MSVLGRVLSLIRKSGAAEGAVQGHRTRLAGARPAAIVRVRSCSVCGGDPRHLCRRCRELVD